jgi:hypothetical protein
MQMEEWEIVLKLRMCETGVFVFGEDFADVV